jgi:uncharacterized protein
MLPQKKSNLFFIQYNGYFLFYNPFAKNRHVVVLNKIAKTVLDHCDGKKTDEEIFRIISWGCDRQSFKEANELIESGFSPRDFLSAFSFFNSPLTLNDLRGLLSDLWTFEIISYGPELIVGHQNFSKPTCSLHLTNQCNFRCKYCYVDKDEKIMDFAVAKKIADLFLEEAKKKGKAEISFRLSGGEALTNFPLVKKIIEYIRKIERKEELKVSIILLTNGSLISEPIAEFIKDNDVHVNLSLDGKAYYNDLNRVYKDGKGTFGDIEKSMDLLMNVGVDLTASVTVSPSTVKGLPEITSYLLDRGIHFGFGLVCPVASSDSTGFLLAGEEIDLFVKYFANACDIIKKRVPPYSLVNNILLNVNILGSKSLYGCGAGLNYWAVDLDGRIYPCPVIFEAANKDKYRLESFSESKYINPLVAFKKKCRDCLWINLCGGACSMAAYNTYGSFDEASPYCEIIKKIIPVAIEVEAERIIKHVIKSSNNGLLS